MIHKILHKILCFFGYHLFTCFVAIPTPDLEHVHDVAYCEYCGKTKVLS